MAEYIAKCDCGQQSITTSSEPVAQLVCHCVDCQRISGNAFTQIAFFQPDNCQISGRYEVTTISGGSGKNKSYYRCESCGECLYATVDLLNGMVGIVANHLLSPFKFQPRFHCWVEEKQAGVDIPAGMVQFAKGANKPPNLI